MVSLEVFLNLYSREATGRLELSASPGMKGLHPVMLTSSGISSSSRSTVANGKRAENVAFSKCGYPLAPLPLPFPPVFALPNTFQSAIGPSRTFAPFSSPLMAIAENMNGSLKMSGLFRTETCEIPPVPSRQIIPAPMPPIGKAIRFRYSYS